ncbi:hypothetical protein ColLi_00899 [Colletotrichum liriopes]|uniref:Uncharacterized protein n=1 Tax=Colletotrichum liriopes TaxID=708192 RepID=A0AA37GBV3_9PEZI|nr:hypothetical protein ColLi_00899 [Colletotrichum liriopes]
MAKPEGRLAELIIELTRGEKADTKTPREQVVIHAERLLAGADALVVPTRGNEPPFNLVDLKKMIANADAVAHRDDNLTATPVKAFSSSQQNFMQHAKECLATTYARNALDECGENDADDGVDNTHSLAPKYDDKTGLVGFRDEKEAAVPKTQDGEAGELLV